MGVNAATGELVVAAREGDREAFGLLVERSWERLVRLARSVLGDLEAEDAAQEGLLVAWSRLGRLADPERFDAWVGRIVFRRCLRRVGRSRGRISLEAVPEASHDPGVVDHLGAWEVLSRLAPRQRAVLHLSVVEGMTDSEIAPLLGITPASVRSHRRRARESAARMLKGGKP